MDFYTNTLFQIQNESILNTDKNSDDGECDSNNKDEINLDLDEIENYLDEDDVGDDNYCYRLNAISVRNCFYIVF